MRIAAPGFDNYRGCKSGIGRGGLVSTILGLKAPPTKGGNRCFRNELRID
jgi:hypothetical protein